MLPCQLATQPSQHVPQALLDNKTFTYSKRPLKLLCCCPQDEIQREETTANVKFLFVDCGPLKQMLTAHCQLWRSKLTNLLNNLAATELRSLHDHFRWGQPSEGRHWKMGMLGAHIVGPCTPSWLAASCWPAHACCSNCPALYGIGCCITGVLRPYLLHLDTGLPLSHWPRPHRTWSSWQRLCPSTRSLWMTRPELLDALSHLGKLTTGMGPVWVC